ncbi:hypothetical protein V1277_005462 [Bradyrhizobium sp. AZCC 1588]
MDCFATLAMTWMRFRVLATHCARGLHDSSPNEREQGMPGACCTRGLVCSMRKAKRTRAYRYSRGTPAFPAQWVDGLCRALPGDEFLLASIAAGLMAHSIRSVRMRHRQLGTSHGCQDHTVLPYASAPYVLRAVFAHGSMPPCEQPLAPDAAASTASRPTFVTMANAPLVGTGRRNLRLIWACGEAKYF